MLQEFSLLLYGSLEELCPDSWSLAEFLKLYIDRKYVTEMNMLLQAVPDSSPRKPVYQADTGHCSASSTYIIAFQSSIEWNCGVGSSYFPTRALEHRFCGESVLLRWCSGMHFHSGEALTQRIGTTVGSTTKFIVAYPFQYCAGKLLPSNLQP